MKPDVGVFAANDAFSYACVNVSKDNKTLNKMLIEMCRQPVAFIMKQL